MLQHGTEQPPVTCSNSPGSSPIRTTRIQSDSECILECIVNGTSSTTQNVGSASPAWKESNRQSSPPPTIMASWCAMWCAMRIWSSLVPVTHGCRLGIGCDRSTVESDRPFEIDKPKYVPFQFNLREVVPARSRWFGRRHGHMPWQLMEAGFHA
jgi:hypothetical protein